MEAAASELPVIATRWSGHLDFLHDRNSYLIDLDGVVPAPPDLDVEYYAGHCWANPSVDHLRQLMRHVFSHPEEARQRAVQARAEMVERWDWNLVSELWANEFHRLLA
jgi:glycosyltransferase involved in cell wall biosynthesis